ncbi:MAG: ribonuclease III [Chloroflexota bacterium]|nr:MAG: ribonuclease III [Chloroflexota bacterium]HDD61504.1 ribonuclease III [Chloroflexota bacterium]
MGQVKGQELIETPLEFNQRAGLGFKNMALLTRVLTHRSYINENQDALEDNERLEFLGDAVLDFIVGAWLYNRYPEMTEGDLTLVRTALVRTEQLAEFASKLDLGRAMRLGQGEIISGGRSRRALLCAGFEALVGGIYLDRGVKAVEDFFDPYIQEAIEKILVDDHHRDPKSLLQEWAQARSQESPVYKTIRESGPDHEKVFEVNVSISGIVSGNGIGNSKREASKLAAQEALDKISQLNNQKKKGN